MTSEAQRRAHQKLAEARSLAGKRSVTVWLSEPARKALDGLAKVHGSREKAIEALLVVPAPAEIRKRAAAIVRETISESRFAGLPLGNIKPVMQKKGR